MLLLPPFPHRSIHLVASVASEPQPSSHETDSSSSQHGPTPLCTAVLPTNAPTLHHVSIRCPSDDSPSRRGKPQRQLQATHLYRHLEEVSVSVSHSSRLPIHPVRCRRSTLAHISFGMGCDHPKHQTRFAGPAQGSPAVRGLAVVLVPCWAVVMGLPCPR